MAKQAGLRHHDQENSWRNTDYLKTTGLFLSEVAALMGSA